MTVDPAIGEAGDVDTAVDHAEVRERRDRHDRQLPRAASYGYDQRVEVLGSKGSIATTNNYPNAAVVSDGASVRRDLPLNFFMDRYTESFATEVVAFVDAVLHDKPVPVTGRDAPGAGRDGAGRGQSRTGKAGR